ncbi:peptidoglycan DD-metalloendopeptidase family protein [bacterium]|nr:peptidoglycan DD-metalloendopeptidase family protein [bacterium]
MMRSSKIFIVIIIVPIFCFSQNKDQLKKQKKAIENEISYTTSLLEKTKENKQASLQYISYLNKKISSQERLIQISNIELSLIKKQINKLENQILFTEQQIDNKGKEILALKNEYGKMLYSLQKNKNDRNSLMFIMSSETFNQAYKRVLYLREYSRMRKAQTLQIIKSQDSLSASSERLILQKQLISEKKTESIDLISNKRNNLNKILESKQEKDSKVAKLQKSEKIFLRKIKDQQKQARLIEEKIKRIIEEEIRLAREKLKTENNSISLTPEAQLLSDQFSANKGNMPWPLEQGLIVSYFGKQKHHVFGNVETFNNGINIATNENAIIRSVFNGKVSRIFFIKGEGKAVLINHGEYFTVYSGLKTVSVKLGDEVLTKEQIGTVLTDKSEKKTELHFEIWQGYDKLNPSLWLYEAN